MGAPRTQGEEGFTLLETVIALTILMLALVPMAGALVECSELRTESEIHYRLQQVAADRLEELRLESDSISGYMDIYPTGEEMFAVADTTFAGLPVSDVQPRVEVVPTNLGTAYTATLRVVVDYTDSNGANRSHVVGTMVSKAQL